MLLKTYTAPDLATALERARAELGPDALVLGTSEKTGRLGLSAVEVTVGAPRAAAPAPDERLPRLASEIREQRPEAPPARTRQEAGRAAPPTPGAWQPHPRLRASVAALVAAGLSADLARRFARIAGHGLTDGSAIRNVAHAAARGLGELVPFAAAPLDAPCTFVVGPPGSGKTTTVAKLVARAAIGAGDVAFFAQADHERIGAFEQAEIFSRHIGAQLARVGDLDDLRCALRHAGPRGRVVVDTPGVGAQDGERIGELLELRRELPEAAVALLVPAGIHHTEAARILDRFAALRPTCVGFSRVDDGALPGQLVTALASRRVPLGFFTTGPAVPDDLVVASPQGLAALLLRAGQAHAPHAETER
jgi:flagellar biosynthesis protein FlhF